MFFRELLYTLSPNELNLLEKSLCSCEEPDVSTPVLGQSEQLLQIDQGFDEGADHVPLEGIGSTILVHSANSGSPVTPVNQDLSDYLPNLASPTTPRGNFQFSGDGLNLDEDLSPLNKSESQDSGLHSENVSTSDTITVDAVSLTARDTGSAIGTVLPPSDEGCDRRETTHQSNTLRRDTTESVEELTLSLDESKWGNDSNENACLKSCCRLEDGGVSHMCREIIEELVDDVVTLNNYGGSLDTKMNSNGNEITRQFSWQYNVQFAIPQISVSDQEIDNVDRDSNSLSSGSTLSDLGLRDHFTDDVLDSLANLSDVQISENLPNSRSEVLESASVIPKCSVEAGTSTADLRENDAILSTCDIQSPPNTLSTTLTGSHDLNVIQNHLNFSEVASGSANTEVTDLLDAGLQTVSSQTVNQNGHMRHKKSSKHRRQGSLERIHCKTGPQNTDSGDRPLEIPRIQRLRYTESVASGRSANYDCDCEKDW